MACLAFCHMLCRLEIKIPHGHHGSSTNRMRPQRLTKPYRGHSDLSHGFTLVEVMLATLFLAILTVGMLTGITFASRTTRLNGNAMAAKNIAQGYFEAMAIDDFADVGPANYPDIDYNSNPPVWLDEALNIRCRVQFKFKGFGTLENATASNLTDTNMQWEPNEWAGDVVCLVSGQGAGQFVTIDSNTLNTLHLLENLDVVPNNGTKYMINNGKTVEITTTWQYMGKEYSQTIESLVVNYRNSANLGF
jgi:type II secretory pathway pseudopilin PulG